MRAELKLGTVLEVVSPQELDARIGQLRQDLLRAMAPDPLPDVVDGDCIQLVTAGGQATLEFRCPRSVAWDIRSMQLSGPSPFTVVDLTASNGGAWVFRGDPNAPGRLKDFTQVLPDIGPWSKGEFVVKPGGRVTVVFRGLVAAGVAAQGALMFGSIDVVSLPPPDLLAYLGGVEGLTPENVADQDETR